MKILAVDCDADALSTLEKALLCVYKDAEVLSFSDPLLAIKYSSRHAVDRVYTEIRLPHLDGITFARMLKRRYPGIYVYLISCSRSPAVPLWEFTGLLRKPVDGAQVRQTLKAI